MPTPPEKPYMTPVELALFFELLCKGEAFFRDIKDDDAKVDAVFYTLERLAQLWTNLEQRTTT